MRRLYFYLLFVPVLFLLGACSTSKQTSITDVNYDNDITGKGQRTYIQKGEFSTSPEIHSATETIALEENFALVEEPNEEPKNLSKVIESKPATTVTLEQTPVEEAEVDVVNEKTTAPAVVEMTKKERKEIRKNIKNGIKSYISQSSGVQSIAKPNLNVLLLILAFFIPPLAVALAVGITKDFWINLLLTLLFFVPGVIHAIIIITRNT